MVFYWTNTGKKINARIEQKSPNILHLSIENTELNREGLLRLKLGSIILIMYACLIWTFERSCNVMWAHGFFALLLLIISLSCIKIVRGERLVLVKDFALQYSTHFMTGGTKTELIPIKHIHDVVINEIFCNSRRRTSTISNFCDAMILKRMINHGCFIGSSPKL
ncbi:uncharacterized protein LOC128741281 isoform X2 [Sabethes cyaneus]|uniref:uncharacterized protein LOC128741281 isoform X2 n=1 Tax=Sabethes cyaneus TaxID=53552 RepID=UPI00237D836F|nr:uncharacterized protein LOC128741281 isoform X2 [Sabethes cyaneus]